VLLPGLSTVQWRESAVFSKLSTTLFTPELICETRAPGSKYRIFPAIDVRAALQRSFFFFEILIETQMLLNVPLSKAKLKAAKQTEKKKKVLTTKQLLKKVPEIPPLERPLSGGDHAALNQYILDHHDLQLNNFPSYALSCAWIVFDCMQRR
jgi:hypothetical protein